MVKEMVLERTIFCTIASFEYKPMVELLVESFFKFHPKNKFIIFSSDLYELNSLNESDNLEWRHLNCFMPYPEYWQPPLSRVHPETWLLRLRESPEINVRLSSGNCVCQS